jgi:transposase InsO family protein
VDVTVLRLLDGTRAYLHAVIDNFSRRILAWRLSDRLLPGGTVAILLHAARSLANGTVSGRISSAVRRLGPVPRRSLTSADVDADRL